MNVHTVVLDILAFMEQKGHSQVTLSIETGIPQSTISRALSRPRRITKTHRAICKFAGIRIEQEPTSASVRDELVQELLGVWDGSREHALSIARLLRAAAHLQAHAIDRVGKPRKLHGKY